MKKTIAALAVTTVSSLALGRHYNLGWRIKTLITRKTVWMDTKTGAIHTDKETLKTIWALVGPQEYSWWWVRKYGREECGCTVNPLTKRRSLMCMEHAFALIDAMDELSGTVS